MSLEGNWVLESSENFDEFLKAQGNLFNKQSKLDI